MNRRVVLRGGGDLATGVAHRLKKAGFEVYILEIAEPTVIRRRVAFASAIFDGTAEVEGVISELAGSISEAQKVAAEGNIPVLIDPEGKYIEALKPYAVVDCILAKRNIGTSIAMAPVVIGVGPGFTAGVDVHAAIETKRGHYLGKVIYEGTAFTDTGIPGNIGGYTSERLLRACEEGIIEHVCDIGELVAEGDIVCISGGQPVRTEIAGVVRGLIKNGAFVTKGMKIGDVDPRGIVEYCSTISDKARSVAGGVLEAVLALDGQY